MVRNQKGNVLGIMLLVILAVGAISFVGSYLHYAGVGAQKEETLIAKRDDNKNVMAAYSTMIKEIAQAFKLSMNAQANLIKIANEARYGEGGSKAALQFIQEQNPNADPQLLNKMTQVIESERSRFRNAQTEMLDIKRGYKTELAMPVSGFFMRLAGYPKIDFKDFEVIINDYTEEAYKSGKAEAIDLDGIVNGK